MSAATNARTSTRPNTDDYFHRGYLTKQGRVVKSWKKRYFVLKNGSLFYYKSPDDVVPLGQMTLFRARCEFTGSNPQNTIHRFAIVTPDRTLHIQSSDMAELKEWAIVIQKAAILETRAKGTCPPLTFRSGAQEDEPELQVPYADDDGGAAADVHSDDNSD